MPWKIILAVLIVVTAVFVLWPYDLDRNPRENRTLLKMQKIVFACKAFRTMHGRWPELDELVTPSPSGTSPMLEGGESVLDDAWGQRLRLEVLPDDTVRVKTYKPDGWPLEWPAR